jgi:hypothetical protein
MPPRSQHVAFGYVVLPPFGGIAEYSSLAGPIGVFAQTLGYCLRGIFVEEPGRSDVSSFHALLREVRLGKATVVVVPDFGDLAHLPYLAGADERTIARFVRARVLPVAGCRPVIPFRPRPMGAGAVTSLWPGRERGDPCEF